MSTLSLGVWMLQWIKAIIYLPPKRHKMILHFAPSRFALQNKPSFVQIPCFFSISWNISPFFYIRLAIHIKTSINFYLHLLRVLNAHKQTYAFSLSISFKWWSNRRRIWAMTLPWRLRRPWWGASEICPVTQGHGMHGVEAMGDLMIWSQMNTYSISVYIYICMVSKCDCGCLWLCCSR